MILELSAIASVVGMTATIVHFTTTRGLLHWLSVWLLNVRAALLNAAWIARQIPKDWRVTYPQAVQYVRDETCLDARVAQPITTQIKDAVSSASVSRERKAIWNNSKTGRDAAPAMMPWLFEKVRRSCRALTARAM